MLRNLPLNLSFAEKCFLDLHELTACVIFGKINTLEERLLSHFLMAFDNVRELFFSLRLTLFLDLQSHDLARKSLKCAPVAQTLKHYLFLHLSLTVSDHSYSKIALYRMWHLWLISHRTPISLGQYAGQQCFQVSYSVCIEIKIYKK